MTERVAVVGAGVVGLAAARALERLGYNCLVFEKGAPGGGQSAGESRIFRHAHADPRQFELALAARRDWQEWEREFGAQLISSDGAMVLGEAAVTRLRKCSDDPAMTVREAGRREVGEVLPLLAGYDGPVLVDEAAGAIRTRLTLASLIESVSLNLVPEMVREVNPRPGGGVEVVSALGSRIFDAVVVAAGTGTTRLAGLAGIEIPVEMSARMRLTMPLSSGGSEARMACLQDSSGFFGETAAYGSPVRGNREYAVGLALTARVDPGNTGVDPLGPLAARTVKYVERALPGLAAEHAVPAQCWVTGLPWATDGLAVWQRGDSYFIAGHNLFKLAPALGKVLARSVDSGSVESGFRPEDRLGEPVAESPGSVSVG